MGDRAEIENLVYRYTALMDGGEWDAFGELFQDGDLVMPAETHEELVLHGPAAVTAWLHANIRRYPDGTPKTNHVNTNVLIEIEDDGRTARASSYLTVFQNVPPDPPGPLQAIFCGRYHDSFVKSGGRWRFVRRTILATSLGDLHAHVVGM